MPLYQLKQIMYYVASEQMQLAGRGKWLEISTEYSRDSILNMKFWAPQYKTN